MELVNDCKYPDTFMDVLRLDSYSRDGANYSVTEVIRPPRIVLLERRHRDTISVPASSVIKSFIGTAIHDACERRLLRVPNKLYLMERRLMEDISGRQVGGKFDIYENRKLIDIKTTSTWKVVYNEGDFYDWQAQLNSYAWMLERRGMPVDRLCIMAIFMDFDPKRVGGKNYPSSMVEEIYLPKWKPEEVESLLTTSVNELIRCESLPDDELPPCSKDDMWVKPDKLAVLQQHKVRAVRVLDSLEEAEQYIVSNNLRDAYVEARLGEPTRCTSFCKVSHVCSQYKQFQQHRQEN